MTVADLTRHVQFIVDDQGNRKAAVLEIAAWQDVLDALEDFEDALDAAEARRNLEPTLSLADYTTQRATCTK